MTPKEKAAAFLQFRAKKEIPVSNIDICQLCDRRKQLSNSNGKMLCSTCAVIVTAVKQRPESVVDALREFNNGSLVPFLTAEESQQVVEIAGIVQPVERDDTAAQALSLKCAENKNTIISMTETIDKLKHERSSLTISAQNLNADNEALRELIKELQPSLSETTKKLNEEYQLRNVVTAPIPAPSLDKTKLAALLAEIGQGIIEARMKLSARVYRELRKLAA